MGIHFRVNFRIMGWGATPRGSFDKDHWWYRGISVRISWSKRQSWHNLFLDSTDIFSESSTAFPFSGVWREKIWLPEGSHFLCWKKFRDAHMSQEVPGHCKHCWHNGNIDSCCVRTHIFLPGPWTQVGRVCFLFLALGRSFYFRDLLCRINHKKFWNKQT